MQAPSQKSIIAVQYGRVIYVKNTLRNKRRSNGERAAESCSFSEGGKRVAIFHLTANICVELKWIFVRMSKQRRNERNYLYLTVELEVAQNVRQFSL